MTGTPPAPPAQPGPVSWRATFAFLTAAGTQTPVLLAVLTMLQALLPVVGLLAMKQLVDAVADGVAARTDADQALTNALLATAIAAAVSMAGGLLQSVVQVANENHGRRLADEHFERLQQHVAHRPLVDFDRPGFHDALQRATAEAGQRPVRLTQDLIAALVATVSLFAMAALLIQVEPWLPVVVGLAAAPIAWVRNRHAKIRFDWQRDHVVEQREVGYLGAALTARATAKDVRVLGLWRRFGARLRGLRAELRSSLATLARRRARDEWFVHVFAGLALFGAYALLAQQALAGAMTLGALVLQAQAAQRTQNAVRDLLASWVGVREHRLFLRPLADFLEACRPDESEPNEPAAAEALAVTADRIHFAYPGSPPVLRDVTFHIEPGERVAIIGPNGSGKSTLIKLLAGLYAPAHGSLLCDNSAVSNWHPQHRQQRLAVLFQDADGYERTLRDNLQLGRPTVLTDEELWHGLDLVGLADRVRKLPQGLDTPWSRRLQDGREWSGGEARRLVLARTLLHGGNLLLLDEPFAALDGRTADRIASHLLQASRARTMVIVDHRGPALRCVDRALWLDRGTVRAIGRPDELARDPEFAAQFPEWLQ